MNEQVLAVQRMQDYIEAHWQEEITWSALANAALFSPWHAYRLFRAHLGLSPAAYLRRLRLSRSAMRLKNEDCRVTDLAFELGFGSVDGYSRAFAREFGMTPGEYARHPSPIALFVPYGVKYRELRKEPNTMSQTKHIFIQTVHKPARTALIRRGVKAEDYFPYCEEVGCDIWGLLTSMDSLCGEPVCLWLPDRYKKPNTSTYVQGVETPIGYDGPIPEGFDVIELPEADYLMFQGEPFAEEDYCAAISDLRQAMNSYDPSVLGYAWDDENPRIQLAPIGERGYIELRAVKPIRKLRGPRESWNPRIRALRVYEIRSTQRA